MLVAYRNVDCHSLQHQHNIPKHTEPLKNQGLFLLISQALQVVF